MKSNVIEEKTQKQINKLENFLKELEVKYEINDREIIIYGEIIGCAYFNPIRWKGHGFSLVIKTDKETFLNLNFDKGSVELNTCKNRMLMTKLIKEVSYIITEQNKLYIVF